jgi:DNA-binding transcriptional MerR regulator
MAREKKSLSMGAAECARRTGLTVRALRVYERRRLIEPRRTGKGWRCYGPQELRRLSVISTLRAFGMTLAQIGPLLATNPPPLARVLQMQLQICSARKEAADKAVELVKTALATIKSGGRLSLDNLCHLTRSMEMENPTALFQIIRPIMNENVTPEEERAVMNWVAARPQDELRAVHESGPVMLDLHRSFQDLREKNVAPADSKAQELVSRLNELVVRSGARNHRAALFEWNAPVALKWMQFADRLMSKRIRPFQSVPDEGLAAYVRAAQVASPWHRALESIVDEAALLMDKQAQPSAPGTQGLVEHLRQICTDFSLGDPLVYVRWAGAMELRWPTEGSKRKQVAWTFLANAIKLASSAP